MANTTLLGRATRSLWEATKVRNLLASLYQGYPVGYLIAWRTRPLSRRTTITEEISQCHPTSHPLAMSEVR